MDAFQTAATIALIIGAGVVGWCANRIVALGERVARLETEKCDCNPPN